MNTWPSAFFIDSASTETVLTMLVNAAVKGLILFALATVVTFVLRRASAATRHLVWFAALLCSLALPLCTWALPKWQALPTWVNWQEASPQISAPPLPTAAPVLPEKNTVLPAEVDAAVLLPPLETVAPPVTSEPTSKTSPIQGNSQIILTIWMVGAVLLIAPLIYSFVALWLKAARSLSITSGELLNAVYELQRELDLRRKVHLLMGSEDAMPMVWGIFRVRLLLPSTAVTWESSRLRGVLLHELAHLRRHDPLSILIAQLALVVHWFNPLAWFALRQLRAEQERACDDYVLRHGVRASDYASDLLAVATHLRPMTLATSALTMANPSRLEGRIIGILDAKRNRRALTRWLVASAGLIAVSVALPLAMLRAANEGGKPEEKSVETPRQRGLMHGIEMDLARVLKVTTSANAAEIEVENKLGQLVLVVGEGESARIVAHNFNRSKKPIIFRAGADDREGRWWDQVRFVRDGESDGVLPILPDGWMPAGRIVFLPAPVKGSDGAEIIAEITSESGKVPLAVRGITGAELSKSHARQIPATSPETIIEVDGRIHALGKGAPDKPIKLPVMAAQDFVGLPRDALSFPRVSVPYGVPGTYFGWAYEAEQVSVTAVPAADSVHISGVVSLKLLPVTSESAREAWKRYKKLLESGSNVSEAKKLQTEFSATLGSNDALVFPIPSEGLFPDTLVVSMTALPRKVARGQWFPSDHHPELAFDGWVFTWPRTEHEWFSQQFDYRGLPSLISHHLNDRKVPPGNSYTSEDVGTMEQQRVEALVEAFRKRPGVKLDRVEPFVAKQPRNPSFLATEERTAFVAGGAKASIIPTFDGRQISPNLCWLDPVFERRNSSSSYSVRAGESVCLLLPGPADPEEIRMLVLRCALENNAPKKKQAQNTPVILSGTIVPPNARLNRAASFLSNVEVKLPVVEPSANPNESLLFPEGSGEAFDKGMRIQNNGHGSMTLIPNQGYEIIMIQKGGVTSIVSKPVRKDGASSPENIKTGETK